jgi:hypothetical protein
MKEIVDNVFSTSLKSGRIPMTSGFSVGKMLRAWLSI